MADPFVAEIRIFAGNFAPTGWAICNGQIMSIAQNTALFSLLGTTYGGDGRTTFALPDLTGRAPMHPGQGPGLSLHDLGESSGSDYVTLLSSEMPAHTHELLAAPASSDGSDVEGGTLARPVGGAVYRAPGSLVTMHPQALNIVGGSSPHNNLQPYLVCTFIIALQGVFPPRG